MCYHSDLTTLSPPPHSHLSIPPAPNQELTLKTQSFLNLVICCCCHYATAIFVPREMTPQAWLSKSYDLWVTTFIFKMFPDCFFKNHNHICRFILKGTWSLFLMFISIELSEYLLYNFFFKNLFFVPIHGTQLLNPWIFPFLTQKFVIHAEPLGSHLSL